MISFATEFPIEYNHGLPSFFDSIREWALGSPHTSLTRVDFDGLGSGAEWRAHRGTDTLEVLSHSSGDADAAAVRYAKRDGELEWISTIVLSRESGASWVSVRVSCESLNTARRLPAAKKPIVVRTLLSNLGGGRDGALAVLSVAHLLGNSDVDLAVRLITGRAGCRLPVVYVSASFDGRYAVEPSRLAAKLAGMAHVVVEPNRAFSLRLKIEADGVNVYGGAVGVYWPDGAGRRSFFSRSSYDSSRDLARGLFEEVRSALVNRRSLERCTWSAVQGLVSRGVLDSLRSAGSLEVAKYCEEFDKEIGAKDELLEDAKREIGRLQAEVRKYEAREGMGSGLVLRTGSEFDLYPSEIADIVWDALNAAAANVAADSRRSHVLKAVLGANTPSGEAARLREKLKDLLRGMKTVDARVRRGLETLGFALSDDAKHFKIVFCGDDRYTFILPKSGSDHRGGLNSAGDIGRLLL